MITIYKILQASKTPIIHQHITSQTGSQSGALATDDKQQRQVTYYSRISKLKLRYRLLLASLSITVASREADRGAAKTVPTHLQTCSRRHQHQVKRGNADIGDTITISITISISG
jgi:hypothetical protein